MKKKDDNILLLADLVGYGNLAMTVMLPILTNMGFRVYNLPTSLISNNFSYGKFGVLDTTPYLRDTMKIWEELNFPIDAVCTGYLVSEEQALLVANYCRNLKAKGTRVYVDPVMADDGELYNGATQHTVEYMRKMCQVADVIFPNFTEAKFLADKYVGRDSLHADEAEDLLLELRNFGSDSVVITSMVVDEQNCTMLYDGENNSVHLLPYKMIPAQFSGTGDLFSSILIGKYQKGETLVASVQTAMDFVARMIDKNKGTYGKANGIPIEHYVTELP